MINKINQEVVFVPKAHEFLLKGAAILTNAVKSTIGPSGHSVILDNMTGPPVITKDGVTVARAIHLKDRLESIGAELIKEVANKTNDCSGDGTTTATVLAHAILSEGVKRISTGCSSIFLKQGIDLATTEVIDYLKKNCIPISSKEDIINVGTISANGDRTIGELLARAIEKVGRDGIIAIEPAKSVHTTLEIVEGMQLESGYVSPFFITNSEKATCELDNPYILITPNKISSLNDIIGILENCVKNSKSLLIICDDCDGDALHTLVVNKTKGILKVCAVKAPSYGEFRADILSDLSTVVGGNIFGASSAISLKNATVNDLGTCKKVIVGRGITTVIGNSDEKTKLKIEERVNDLRTLLLEDKTLDALHIDKYRKRLAHLSGGIAVVKVGGSTETEINEKKDRVEDAVNATMAAVQEGIVCGGGTALFYAAQHLRELMRKTNFNNADLGEDVVAGIEMMANVCETPFRAIVDNTGVSPDVVAEKLKQNLAGRKIFYVDVENALESPTDVIEYMEKFKTDTTPVFPEKPTKDKMEKFVKEFEESKQNVQQARFRFGYNAATKKYGDLIADGVVDPVKVTRYALENASSVVGLMLTCDTVIVNQENEDE